MILLNQKQKGYPAPLLLVDPVINLGTIQFSDTTCFDIPIKNIGKQPLSIDYINTPCGCLNFKFDTTPVLPSDTLTIHFFYKPASHGYIEQNIFFYFDHLETPLHATIKSRVQLPGIAEASSAL